VGEDNDNNNNKNNICRVADREIDRCQAERYRVKATIERLVSSDTRCAHNVDFEKEK
jgi:hypothetical protein